MSKTLSLPCLLSCQLVAVALTSILGAGSTLAQTQGPAPAARKLVAGRGEVKPGTTITYKQKTNYDLDDEDVTGTLIQPDTDLVTGRLKAKHDSLVQPRTTFQPEM